MTGSARSRSSNTPSTSSLPSVVLSSVDNLAVAGGWRCARGLLQTAGSRQRLSWLPIRPRGYAILAIHHKCSKPETRFVGLSRRVAWLADFLIILQDAVHRANRAEVLPLIQKRRADIGRGLVGKGRAVEHIEDLGAILVGKRPRRLNPWLGCGHGRLGPTTSVERRPAYPQAATSRGRAHLRSQGSSTAFMASSRRCRAAAGESPGVWRVSLNLDHCFRLTEFLRQPLVFTPQPLIPGDERIAGFGFPPATFGSQPGQGAVVPPLSPSAQMRQVQPFAPQQAPS